LYEPLKKIFLIADKKIIEDTKVIENTQEKRHVIIWPYFDIIYT
jgi:hypothetical protein